MSFLGRAPRTLPQAVQVQRRADQGREVYEASEALSPGVSSGVDEAQLLESLGGKERIQILCSG